MEQKTSTMEWATGIGWNTFGTATFALSAAAMVVGSLLRDVVHPQTTKELLDA
jgi:hypothetical protein